MLRIKCKKKQKDEIKNCLFTELSQMYLHSIRYLDTDKAEFDEVDLAMIETAKGKLKRIMKVKETISGFVIDTKTTENVCFCLTKDDENSYLDGYHADKDSSIEYTLQKVIDRFPGTKISGSFVEQGNCYYDERKIKTQRGIITYMDYEGKYKTVNITID